MTNGNTNSDNLVHVDLEQDQSQIRGAQKKNEVTRLRAKKIADDQRTTTPYMTKYEKARVLGVRATQIRYVMTVMRTALSEVRVGNEEVANFPLLLARTHLFSSTWRVKRTHS